ncbi:MAG: hypothetical protein N2485_04955 [bacterium]|nr:hypothetical protein [bacterium]
MSFYKFIEFLIKNKLIVYIIFFISYFFSFYFDELIIKGLAIFFDNLFFILFSFFLFYLLLDYKNSKRDMVYISILFSTINALWIIFLFKYINFIYAFLGIILSIFILFIFWFLKFIFLPFIFKVFIINNKMNFRFIGYFFISIIYSIWWLIIEFIQYNLKDLDMSFAMIYFNQTSNYIFFLFYTIHPFVVSFIFVFLSSFLATLAFEVYYYKNQLKNFKFYIILFFIFYFFILLFNIFYFKNIEKHSLSKLEEKILKNNINFILIQTEIDAYFNKFNQRNYEELYNKLFKLNKNLNKDDSFFVVLIPEGAFPKNSYTLFYLQDNFNLNLKNVFKNYKFNAFIFNTIAIDDNQNIYNSIICFDKSKDSFNFYLKRYLVPFGEYYPFWFLKLFGSLNIENLKYKSYTSGVNFKGNNYYFDIKDIKFKVLICFESFKYERKSKTNDIDFILVSSNDMWFKNLFMDNLHLKSIKILSIYNLLPVVFNANGNKNGVLFIFNFQPLKGFIIF